MTRKPQHSTALNPPHVLPDTSLLAQLRTRWMVKGGTRNWKPPKGGRLQLVTNLSRAASCLASKPSTTCNKRISERGGRGCG